MNYFMGHQGQKHVIQHLNKFYQKILDEEYMISGNPRRLTKIKEDTYLVSPKFNKKLLEYDNVKYIKGSQVWICDAVVIKLFFNKDEFVKSVEIQNLLASHNIGCKIIDTIINNDPHEYICISEYGGQSIALKYNLDEINDSEDRVRNKIPENTKINLDRAITKLDKLGYIQLDNHYGNIVEDDNGNIRFIDCETMTKLENNCRRA